MDPKRRTMWRRIGLLCFLVLGFLLAGCSDDDSDGVKVTHLEKPYPQPEPMEPKASMLLNSEEISLEGDGTFMLEVDRSIDWGPGGSITLQAEFTVYMHDVVGPGQKQVLSGGTETEADFVVNAYGTEGSHTSTWSLPVRYDVIGDFYPAPRCELEIDLTETMYLSRMTVIDSTLVGPIPGDFETVEDLKDTFKLKFMQGSYHFNIGEGMSTAVFRVSDFVLPQGTGCSFK